MTIKEVKELIEKYKDKPIIVRTGYACFDYTESGEELIKVVTSMTEYKEPQFVPNPNGTITFYMPTEDGDGLGKIYVIKITSDKDTDLLNRLQYYKNRVDKQYFSDDLKRGNQIVMYCFNGDIEDCRDIAYSYFSYVRQQVIDCLDKYDNDEMCDE